MRERHLKDKQSSTYWSAICVFFLSTIIQQGQIDELQATIHWCEVTLNVRKQAKNQVGNQTGSQVRKQTRNQVGNQVRNLSGLCVTRPAVNGRFYIDWHTNKGSKRAKIKLFTR